MTLCSGLLFHTFTPSLAVLGYLLLFGLGWDILYQAIVGLRWNRDWPTPVPDRSRADRRRVDLDIGAFQRKKVWQKSKILQFLWRKQQ